MFILEEGREERSPERQQKGGEATRERENQKKGIAYTRTNADPFSGW